MSRPGRRPADAATVRRRRSARRGRVGRVAAVVIVLASRRVLDLDPRRARPARTNPDRLDDRSLRRPARRQPLHATALTAIDALPPAHRQSRPRSARADVRRPGERRPRPHGRRHRGRRAPRRATTRIRSTGGSSDWRTYLGDRATTPSRLRHDHEPSSARRRTRPATPSTERSTTSPTVNDMPGVRRARRRRLTERHWSSAGSPSEARPGDVEAAVHEAAGARRRRRARRGRLGDPAQASDSWLATLDRAEWRDDQEADVEVEVGRLARRLDLVDVEVDRRHRDAQVRRCRSPPSPRAGRREPGCRRRRRDRRAGTSGRACGGASAACAAPVGVDHERRAGEVAARAQRRCRASGWASTKARIVGDASAAVGDRLPRPCTARPRGPSTAQRRIARRRGSDRPAVGSDRPSTQRLARRCGSPGTNQRHGGRRRRVMPIAGADARARRRRGRRRRRSSRRGRRSTRSAPSKVPVDAQGLAQLGRAAAQVAVAPGRRTARPASRRARRAARAPAAARRRRRRRAPHDDVGAPVHAVGEVHVQVPGRPEHRRVARRRAAEGVAGRVVAPQYASTSTMRPAAVAAHEHLVEQLRARPRAGRAGRTREASRRRATSRSAGLGGRRAAGTSSGTGIVVGRARRRRRRR